MLAAPNLLPDLEKILAQKGKAAPWCLSGAQTLPQRPQLRGPSPPPAELLSLGPLGLPSKGVPQLPQQQGSRVKSSHGMEKEGVIVLAWMWCSPHPQPVPDFDHQAVVPRWLNPLS